MNVAKLLQDSPSGDRLRRQEPRDNRQDREREVDREREREAIARGRERDRDREREREREREWDRGREWDRDRERLQRDRSSLSSASLTSAPPPPHRPFSPPGNALPPRSHMHLYDSKQPPPPPGRAPPNQFPGSNHAYTHSPGTEAMHARTYSQDSHPPSSTHSHSHSPPAPLFLSPVTPREGAAAGPVPEMSLGTEYSADYPHRTKNSSQQSQATGPPTLSRLDEREGDYRQRAHSLSGSTRPRTPPPYGDYRDAGRNSPTTARLGSKQHSPAQGSYSVVPPSPSHPQQQFSPPLSNSLNSGHNSSSLPSRVHPNQGTPLSRRPPPPPPSSLPPPPSTSLNRSHENGGAPTNSAIGRSFEERPYLVRAPSSSSSSVMSAGRGHTLKEDIEREREAYERERERERREKDLGRGRGRELDHSSRSRSASASAGVHPGAPADRVSDHDRDFAEYQRMKDMDTIRAAAESRMQGQPRDARERDTPRHHHHHHHHPVSHPHPHPHPNQNMHSQQQQSQQQHASQQQQPSHIPATPYTYAHTGKPRISRSGVLKLAPPGVTVPNNVPPSSSDMIFVGAPGVVIRQETLTLAPPTHGQPALQLRQEQQQQQAPPPGPLGSSGLQPIEHVPVDATRRSPPNPPEMQSEESQTYNERPQGYPDGPHPIPHPQQHPPSSGRHRSYSVGPTGPGVPPPSGALPPSGNLHPSMMAAQQQHQQQHAQQFGSPIPPPHPANHPHQQPLPPQSRPSPSANGIHAQGPPHLHSNPYRHMPSGMPPQNYPPPPMHFNEVPPPPVPMALQPIHPPTPPVGEPIPTGALLHLGTFVSPHTPFPYLFPTYSDSDLRMADASPGQPKKFPRREADLIAERRERLTSVTVLVPSALLPSSLPIDGQARIWGGAPFPVHAPWGPYANYVTRSHSTPIRRIYTDDSDIVLCALHSGRISWGGVMRARAAGLDLSIKLILHRDLGRYFAAPSAFADGTAIEGAPGVDVGLKKLLDSKSLAATLDNALPDGLRWLMAPSSSWDTGHDGSGIEVVSTEWLPRGSARRLGLRNRSQRLREYTERRRVIMKAVPPDDLIAATKLTTSVLGKRPVSLQERSTSSLYRRKEDPSAVKTILGSPFNTSGLSFKYDGNAVYSFLTSLSITSSTPPGLPRGRRKRRKLQSSNRDDEDLQSEAGTDGRRSLSPRWSGNTNTAQGVVLENDKEQYLLALRDSSDGTDDDKENRITAVDGSAASAKKRRSYDLYLLPSSSSSFHPPGLHGDAERENPPVVNGNAARKPHTVIPLTPNSGRSETASPQNTGEHLDSAIDTASTAGNVDTPCVETISKDSGKAAPMPTPPTTTETEHPPSPALHLVNGAVKGKSEGTIAAQAQVLYRDLAQGNLSFSTGGLGFLLPGMLPCVVDSKEAPFIRVDRWRSARPHDFVLVKGAVPALGEMM